MNARMKQILTRRSTDRLERLKKINAPQVIIDIEKQQLTNLLTGPQPTPDDYRIFKGTPAEFFEKAAKEKCS